MCTLSGNVIGSQEVNVHLSHCRGVVLEGNYIYSGHRRNMLFESCRNLVIGANCLGHNPDYKDLELCTGIRLADCSFVNLTGLQMQDAQAGQNTVKDAPPVDRQGLLEIVRCRHVNLNGVQLLEGSPAALYIEESDYVHVQGCTILDTRSTPLTTHSILWRGQSQGSVLANTRVNCACEIPEIVAQVNVWGK
jgi:polygalacturonase